MLPFQLAHAHGICLLGALLLLGIAFERVAATCARWHGVHDILKVL